MSTIKERLRNGTLTEKDKVLLERVFNVIDVSTDDVVTTEAAFSTAQYIDTITKLRDKYLAKLTVLRDKCKEAADAGYTKIEYPMRMKLINIMSAVYTVHTRKFSKIKVDRSGNIDKGRKQYNQALAVYQKDIEYIEKMSAKNDTKPMSFTIQNQLARFNNIEKYITMLYSSGVEWISKYSDDVSTNLDVKSFNKDICDVLYKLVKFGYSIADISLTDIGHHQFIK